MIVDLHVHSQYSYDCFQSVETVLNRAKKVGLDAVAITDHDTFAAHKHSHAVPDDLLLIPGMEIKTMEIDDLLALFVQEPIESRRFLQAVDEIHDQDGLAILPHPYRKVEQYQPEYLEVVDAIETMNARSKQRNNERAAKLAATSDWPTTGSSDAHTPWEIGQARTGIEETVETASDLKRAIESGLVQPKGKESSYYLYHGLSFGMELAGKFAPERF